jgi:predicted amidohydrolase YtcJ
LTWSEGERGTLEVGKAADLLVMADDPLTCDEIIVKDIPVERTFVSGREVFTAPGV